MPTNSREFVGTGSGREIPWEIRGEGGGGGDSAPGGSTSLGSSDPEITIAWYLILLNKFICTTKVYHYF